MQFDLDFMPDGLRRTTTRVHGSVLSKLFPSELICTKIDLPRRHPEFLSVAHRKETLAFDIQAMAGPEIAVPCDICGIFQPDIICESCLIGSVLLAFNFGYLTDKTRSVSCEWVASKFLAHIPCHLEKFEANGSDVRGQEGTLIPASNSITFNQGLLHKSRIHAHPTHRLH